MKLKLAKAIDPSKKPSMTIPSAGFVMVMLLGFVLTNMDPLHNDAYASSTIDNGYTGVFNTNTEPNPLTTYGSLFTGLTAGTIGTMTMDVGANCGGDTLKGALYDSSGKLLSASNSILCTVGKMNVTLNSPVTVPADGKLWATVMSSGGHAQFNAKNTGTNTSYLGTTQGSLNFPNTISSMVNAIGTSSPSSTASATTAAAPNVTPSSTANSITLSWNPISGMDYYGYVVGLYGTSVATNTLTQTSVTIPNLQPNTTYSIQVSAHSPTGWGPDWNQNVSTAGTTTTPTGLTANAISSSQINLSWTAPNNGGSAITGYTIERSADSGSTWSSIVSNTGSTGTTYSDTGLTSNTSYTYRVSSINAIGTSSI
jgi:hypothetical protein